MSIYNFTNRIDIRMSALIGALTFAWCTLFIVTIKKVEKEREYRYAEHEIGRIDADIKNNLNRILNDILLEHSDALELTLSDLFRRHDLSRLELRTFKNRVYAYEQKQHTAARHLYEQTYDISYDGYEYGKLNYGKVMLPYLTQAKLSSFWLYLSVLAMFIVFFAVRIFVKGQVVEPIKTMIDSYGHANFEMLTNIHRRKSIPAEMKQLIGYFMSMQKTLNEHQDRQLKDARLIAIGQSTAMVAHDVRKPLASMKALLMSLSDIKDDPEQLKNMMAAVDRSITHTNAMLDDILDFSRDATALKVEEGDPQSLLISALSDVFRKHRGTAVKVAYDLKHKRTLRVDNERVTRVFANIIDNGIDAMEGKRECADAEIRVGTYQCERDGKNYVNVTIADNGPGISDNILPKLFDPFFTYGKKGGTGLGLAICQRIIAMHGGRIEARNRTGGHGAEFVIELPAGDQAVEINEEELIHDSNELKPFREEQAVRVEYGDTANTAEFMRINKERGRPSYLLIVDDEPLFRETVRTLFSDLGQVKDHVKIVEADSAEIALELFKAREFDYVIADIDLGKRRMNGYEFSQMVLEKYPDTYVLIHSNKRRGELDKDIREIASDKFMGFLPKPMKSSELLQFLACKTFEAPEQNKDKVTETESKRKVLVVNDDDTILLMFRMMLKSPDIHVLEASNVSTALKTLTEQKVDIILSDINLGEDEPDGYEFLRQVREKSDSIPFYMVSGFSRSDEEPKAKERGATGYLQLPVESHEIMQVLGV